MSDIFLVRAPTGDCICMNDARQPRLEDEGWKPGLVFTSKARAYWKIYMHWWDNDRTGETMPPADTDLVWYEPCGVCGGSGTAPTSRDEIGRLLESVGLELVE